MVEGVRPPSGLLLAQALVDLPRPAWESTSELGYQPPRHRADAVLGTTSRRWRETSTPSSRCSHGNNILISAPAPATSRACRSRGAPRRPACVFFRYVFRCGALVWRLGGAPRTPSTRNAIDAKVNKCRNQMSCDFHAASRQSGTILASSYSGAAGVFDSG